jgi:hypothetical protein
MTIPIAKGTTKATAKVASLEYGTVRLASAKMVDPRVMIHRGIIAIQNHCNASLTKIVFETHEFCFKSLIPNAESEEIVVIAMERSKLPPKVRVQILD